MCQRHEDPEKFIQAMPRAIHTEASPETGALVWVLFAGFLCSHLFLKIHWIKLTTPLTKLFCSLVVPLSGNSSEQKRHDLCLWLPSLTSEWEPLIILWMVPSQVLWIVNTAGGLYIPKSPQNQTGFLGYQYNDFKKYLMTLQNAGDIGAGASSSLQNDVDSVRPTSGENSIEKTLKGNR